LRIIPTEAETQHAAIEALLAEDKGLRVLAGRVDLFSFDERARELDAVEKFASAPPPRPTGGDEGAFEALEAELLARLVSEERARVDEERHLPRSGSELLRGVVATWTAPAAMSELKDRDDWLAERLDEMLGGLAGTPLRAVEITELEDALDPIEHLADPQGFARSAAALTRLRLALGADRATVSGGMGWDALSAGLGVHLGIHEPEATVRSEIERTEQRLREEAVARLSQLPEESARSVRQAAAEILLAEGSCETQSGRSSIRSAAPPPERSPVCGALGAIARAKTEPEALAALIAVHDAVAMAGWALVIHLDDGDPEQAPQGRALIADVPPEHEGRFIRFAATRPLACIAVARMASLLDADGPENRQSRAKRWLAFGEAPLDIVEREWGAR
jgi:hypothetical protein